MALDDKTVELKLQLQSVSKQHFKLERKVHSLRKREDILIEEITNLKTENGYFQSQITNLSSEICQLKSRNAIINVFTESEKAKIDVHLSNLDKYKDRYDILFKNERAISTEQREQLKQKELEEKEVERQKMAKILEKNQKQAKDAAAIEDECVAIERECGLLLKRNKAVMLNLRRKLFDTENVRRELMKKMNPATTNTIIEQK